jgi:hypothetical protein
MFHLVQPGQYSFVEILISHVYGRSLQQLAVRINLDAMITIHHHANLVVSLLYLALAATWKQAIVNL